MSEALRQRLLDDYLSLRPALKRFLVARLRDDTLAEDLLQDMYLRLARANLERGVTNPSAFLYQMAHNLVLDHRKMALRRQKRSNDWSDANHSFIGTVAYDDRPDAENQLENKQKHQALKEAISQLPEQCRKAFILHKLNGNPQKQVAEKMGISVKTVEKHMARAIRLLSAHMAK